VAIASFVAGTLGTGLLMAVAPPLADWALSFGPPEYFSLVLLGLTIIVSLAGESVMKGLLSGALGLLLGTVGIDPLTGDPRLTFGSATLMSGIDFICAIVGLFAVAEVLRTIEEKVGDQLYAKLKGLFPTWRDLRQSGGPMLRGSILGFLIGVLPGASTAVSSFLAYDLEKRVSRHPEMFGHGAIEGIAACEAANNSAVSGGFVPLLTLGLPVSGPMAVLLAAFMIHGVRPGPLLFSQHPDVAWGLIASMYIGNVILLILNFPLIPMWVSIARVPYRILGPVILGLSVIGAYSVRNNIFDVWVAFGFGVLGFVMQKFGYPIIPLVIGLILGDPFESSLRQSLTMSGGNPAIFFRSGVSTGLVLLAVASLAAVVARRRLRRGTRAPQSFVPN